MSLLLPTSSPKNCTPTFLCSVWHWLFWGTQACCLDSSDWIVMTRFRSAFLQEHCKGNVVSLPRHQTRRHIVSPGGTLCHAVPLLGQSVKIVTDRPLLHKDAYFPLSLISKSGWDNLQLCDYHLANNLSSNGFGICWLLLLQWDLQNGNFMVYQSSTFISQHSSVTKKFPFLFFSSLSHPFSC